MSDILETNVNMALGMVINCTVTYYMFGVTPLFALGSTGVFFALSWTRYYLIRKWFRYRENRVKL